MIEQESFFLGVAVTAMSVFWWAFLFSLLTKPKNKKYCPKCGRMLMVYEHEEIFIKTI
jgi:hypothetical protein